MRKMTDTELWNVSEALLSAKAELEELERTEDWYTTETIDRIDTALEIIRRIKVGNSDDIESCSK